MGRTGFLIAVLLPLVVGVVVLAGIRPWREGASPAARAHVVSCIEVRAGPAESNGEVVMEAWNVPTVSHTLRWDPPRPNVMRDGACAADPLFR